jgi:hypothetical protein
MGYFSVSESLIKALALSQICIFCRCNNPISKAVYALNYRGSAFKASLGLLAECENPILFYQHKGGLPVYI